jgi:hypothetical protein
LLKELIRLGYLLGHNLVFIGVAKRTLEHNTTEIIIASETTKQYLLHTPIFISGEKVMIQILASEPSANPVGPKALTTTILVRGLPIEFSQTQITVAIHHLLGAKNVVIVTFNRAEDDPLGRHDGMASIRCINAAVYTHWCDRHDVPLLGKQVDFTPHAKSFFGSSLPALVARNQLDSRPTWQIIEEAIMALKNENPTTPNMLDMEKTIRNAKGRIKDHIDAISSTINSHTMKKATEVQAVQQYQHTYLLQQLQVLSTISKEYSNHMSGISTALLQGPFRSPTTRPPGLQNLTDVDD